MAKTLDAIRNLSGHPDAIVEAGEVVDIRFPAGTSLSLRAAKLFHLLVQAAGVSIADAKQHRMTFATLNESFHVSVSELKGLVDELHSTILKLRLTDENGRAYTKSGPILSDVEREDENLPQAEIRFEFSSAMRKAIENSSHWAIISRKAVLAFESKYSLRLYTVLSLRTGLRKVSEDFLLEDLRALLGVPEGTYERWNNLNQWVLQPSLAEINQLAGFVVGFIPLRHGRKIVGVRLTWGVKDHEARVEALRELEASRVGRKARREGQVEMIARAEKIERQDIALALSKITE
jgi:plasmid replication initiation protein